MDRQTVEDLLEEEEKKAQAKAAAAKKTSGRLSPPEGPEPIPASPVHDPRRNGRDRERGYERDRYSVEREENDQRRSRRSKDLAEDEEMRDASDDKGSANGSVRSRRRSRSPDSDRRARRSSHDRDSYRERDRLDRGGDYYRGGGRAPVDRNDDDRYRPTDRRDPRYRERERERSPRRRDRDLERYSSGRDPRDRRRSPDPPKKHKTPEPTDDERDRRTVFVQQLAARLRTKELKTFFEPVGKVVEAQIVKDRVSGRSKG